ncbi:MAG: hypothetical protein EHM58_19890 [Ignavibacteriae bacterium]|nr:MAG: hypothetical protein EHM58_19890 [Ignavibacteriota bacterium]
MKKGILLSFILSFIIMLLISSCKEETIVNPNPVKISYQEIYYTQFQNTIPGLKTYTISQTGTNKQLVSDGFGIISEPHSYKMLTAKIDSGFYYNDLTVMNIDGTNPVTLPVTNYYPVWAQLSPDASKVFFTCNAGNYLFVINSDGTGLIEISNDILGTERAVSFSPDSKKIAFIESLPGVKAQLTIADVNGSNKINIKDSINYSSNFTIDWSPDGSKIAFQNSTPPNIVSIYTVNTDGTNYKNLTNAYQWDNYPSWSPDGNYLAFFSIDNLGQRGMYVINSDGTNKRLLFLAGTNEYMIFTPMWYINGKKILYVSNVNNTDREVKIYDFDTGAITAAAFDVLYAFWNYTILIYP